MKLFRNLLPLVLCAASASGQTIHPNVQWTTSATASSILYADATKLAAPLAMTGNSGKYLTTDGTVPSWATVTVPLGADPSGTVGLANVVGSATTFLRSDGAPPLSQAITPTWTGTHIFSNATLTASFAKAQNGLTAAEVKNTTSSTTAGVYLDLLGGANEVTLYSFSALYNQTTYMGIAAGGYNLLRSAGTSNGLMIETSGASQPIIIGTNNVERLRLTDSAIQGAASNMTLIAGTGNSRTMTLQTTTSGGTATSFIVADATQGITASSLAGTGSRAVLADANGLLSAPVSDELWKEPLRPLPESYGLATVMLLQPSIFKYRDKSRFGQQDYIGFGARATAAVLPEVTGQDRDGTYYLTDEKITAVLVKALQQQEIKIKALQSMLKRSTN